MMNERRKHLSPSELVSVLATKQSVMQRVRSSSPLRSEIAEDKFFKAASEVDKSATARAILEDFLHFLSKTNPDRHNVFVDDLEDARVRNQLVNTHAQ